MNATLEQITDEVQKSHIADLQKQNAALLASNTELKELVRTIPSLLLQARLDSKAGIHTPYDYTRHNAVLHRA